MLRLFKKTSWLGGLALLCGSMAWSQTPDAWREPNTGIEFVWIGKGCFQMGSNRPGAVRPRSRPTPPRLDEVPEHQVCLDGFWLARHEITRGQWQTVMGSAEPDEASQRAKAYVSWEDAQAFIKRLNATVDSRASFRLPTEAQWEYACHAGQPVNPALEITGEFEHQLAEFAWYNWPFQTDIEARPVGKKQPNKWGLYDMLGNVWEWVADSYLADGYSRHTSTNPLVTAGGDRHVLRGGSFKSDIALTRCGARNFGVNNDRLPTAGLRIVRIEATAKALKTRTK